MQASVSSPRGESRAAKAARDVVEGVESSSARTALVWQDGRERDKRPIFGPFWITLTEPAAFAATALLYAAFVPYLMINKAAGSVAQEISA